MPVEIKELVIRTTVDRQNTPAGSNSSEADCASPSTAENDEEQLSEVLNMIKNQNER